MTYRFAKGMAVHGTVDAYPNLGITLQYADGKLVAIEHKIEAPVEAASNDVIAESQHQLGLFLELLRYWWGSSLRMSGVAAQLLVPPDSAPVKGSGVVAVPASVTISRPIRLPPEQVLRHAPPRLGGWLRLANEARDASDPTDAIRNYYMVWEDMKGRPNKNSPSPELKLKYVRDFVSHGGPLTNQDLLAFLRREFGRRVTQYDPTDTQHRTYVNQYRNQARVLVEPELEKLL